MNQRWKRLATAVPVVVLSALAWPVFAELFPMRGTL